jgi:NADH dehydrogenase
VILLTGATGFVGSRVAHALRARGLPVRGLVRTQTSDAAHQLESWGCELTPGDMTDGESLRRATDGVDTVVHLAAIRQGKPEDFERVMIRGTRDLVEAAKLAGARRIVLMSALGTTEQTKDLVPYYGAKWEMERTVRAFGLEHVILRPSFIFARDGGILGTFRKLVRIAPVTPVIGPGTQRIQPIWIDDVAEYFARSVDLAEATDRLFELGGPDAVTWNEFWARLRRTVGVRRRPTVHVPIGFMRVNALVTERLPGDIPLTRDLLKMLEGPDNIVSENDAPAVFGVAPIMLDEQLRRAAV